MIDREFAYDGSQLRSLFAYLDFGVQGDSVVSWVGPCSIPFEHMVDGEDLLAKETIAGSKMVHFIVEKFNTQLLSAVALQRLFAAICLEIVRDFVSDPKTAMQFRRSGDDLYFLDGKLSISIATVSPVSALIHFAVNVSNDGTPVRTSALSDFKMKPEEFARKVIEKFVNEIHSIEEATVKVRWVK